MLDRFVCRRTGAISVNGAPAASSSVATVCRNRCVPTVGTPQSVKALLDRLDEHALCVERVTVHTADLDDVFFALTGHHHKGQDAPS